MVELAKEEILDRAKTWFKECISENHIKNTLKLTDPNEFNINPFLAVYLANFLTGNSSPESIAKALVYPRVLGTSITTSFGQHIQNFAHTVLEGYGSTTQGIDIEFIDKLDGNKKFCQLKLGPNTINKDDVESIAGHFRAAINLARTNNLRLPREDLIVGIIYGDKSQLSSHYKRITKQYDFPVIVGNEFWHRLTGDENFYSDLLASIGGVATEANFSEELNDVIAKLAQSDEIRNIS